MDLHPTSTKAAVVRSPSWVSLFAVQDVLLLGYLILVWGLLHRAGATAVQTRQVIAAAALVAFAAVFARGVFEVPVKVRAVAYRLALTAAVVVNYLMLRDILPQIRPDAVDSALLEIDLALFGVEPALWLERLNTWPVVEYFSFFYYSYFIICLSYLILAVYVLRPGRATAEFAIGTVLTYCVGQLGYMAVPAYGPVVALADQFAGPVNGGFFWGCVTRAVAAGGAMKDVFPSLHTAGPVWFALFAFERARTDGRFRPLAWVTAFFAANIIFSTMFLRWHYAIDVVAGLALAFGSAVLARRLAAWEGARRRLAGFGEAWVFPSA